VSVSHMIVDTTKVHANASNSKISHRNLADRFTKTAMTRSDLDGFIGDEKFVYDASRDVFGCE